MGETPFDYRPTFYRSLSEATSTCVSNSGNSTGGSSSPCGNEQALVVSSCVQLSGVVQKKPFGQQSSKWTKRFVIIKDGFLLYYPESEKKSFDRGVFNLHPRGVLPLGGCTVKTGSGNTLPPYNVEISNKEFSGGCTNLSPKFSLRLWLSPKCNGFVTLGLDTQREQERWSTVLQHASRITWKNFQLGDAMIRELETQGLQLCKEKQTVMDKLQEEVSALRDEIDRNEELEKIAEELEKEKKELEETIARIQDDHNKTRMEYDDTVEALKLLEDDKKQLQATTELLQDTLTELGAEREHTLHMLKRQEAENQSLFVTTEELQNSLEEIEEEIQLLLADKSELERRFLENQVQAQVLTEEKQIFCEQANYLLLSLNDLHTQKELTEAELKEEIRARVIAERRLKAAEESINRLEVALKLAGDANPPKQGEVSTATVHIQTLLPDVQNLKEYFEHVALEAELDANKPLIMKNALVARKAYIERLRNSKLQKARQDKDKSLATIFVEGEGSETGGGLRRTKSMLLNNQTQKKLANLRRSMSTRTNRPVLSPPASVPGKDLALPSLNECDSS